MRSPRVPRGCGPGRAVNLNVGSEDNHRSEPPQTRGRSKNKKVDGENPTATRCAFQRGFWGNHRAQPPQTITAVHRLKRGFWAIISENLPEREPDRSKEAGTGQGVVPTPVGRERFFWPVAPGCGEGPWWRIPVGPVARPSCSLYLSVRGWFPCSSHDLLSTSTQQNKRLSNLSSAMAMFQMVEI